MPKSAIKCAGRAAVDGVPPDKERCPTRRPPPAPRASDGPRGSMAAYRAPPAPFPPFRLRARHVVAAQADRFRVMQIGSEALKSGAPSPASGMMSQQLRSDLRSGWAGKVWMRVYQP